MAREMTGMDRFGERVRMSVARMLLRASKLLWPTELDDPLASLRKEYPGAPDEWLKLVSNSRNMGERKLSSSLLKREDSSNDRRTKRYTPIREETIGGATRYVEKSEREARVRVRFVEREPPVENSVEMRMTDRQTGGMDLAEGLRFSSSKQPSAFESDKIVRESGSQRIGSEANARPMGYKTGDAGNATPTTRFPRNIKQRIVPDIHYAALNREAKEEAINKVNLNEASVSRNRQFVDHLTTYEGIPGQDNEPDGYATNNQYVREIEKWPSLMEEVPTNSEPAPATDTNRVRQLIEYQEGRGWSGSRF